MVKKKGKVAVGYFVLILGFLFSVFPYAWMIISSLKSKEEIFVGGFLPDTLMFSNYSLVLFDTPLLRYMANSVFTSSIIVLVQVIGAITSAYVLVRIKKKWVGMLFVLMMAMYMLPSAATYIPSYILISDMNLLDTHLGYILSESISIFSVFFLRQSFRQVPEDVIEAAKLDSVGDFRMIIHIFVPYCKNTIASLVLINFIYSYNNYMWPSLLLKSEETMLATVGLRKLFSQQAGYGTNWPVAMAACTISLLPIFILLIIGNKRIIKSMSGLYVNK